MLSYADIHQLNRIARHYDCDCNTNSKRDLIQSILTAVGRKEVFERYIESLSVEDVRFLNSLLFDPRDAYSLEELLARAQISRFDNMNSGGGSGTAAAGASGSLSGGQEGSAISVRFGAGAESAATRGSAKKRTQGRKGKKETEEAPAAPSPREMIVKFAHQGWLFNGCSQQTKFLYQVPSDLKRRFCDMLAETYRRQLNYVYEPPAYRDEQGLLAEDVLKFLKFIRLSGAGLTADGSMYKRTVLQLLEQLNVREEPVGKGGWRFGYGRRINEYPNRFSLIYDYCYYGKLIDELEGELALTEKGAALVLEGRMPDQGDLYRFWLRLYKNPIHNLQTIVHWIDRLAADWVTLESLSRVLIPLIRPYYYDSAESILTNRIVIMMMHLGLLRVGESPADGAVIRMTRLGSAVVRGNKVHEEERIALPPGAAPRPG